MSQIVDNSILVNSRSSSNSSSFYGTSIDQTPDIGLPYQFHVICLSTRKILKEKIYRNVSEIQRDAFMLFDHASFNETNAILTYLDQNRKERVLIDEFPPRSPKNQHQELFIRFIHPTCAMCSSSFGILDDQILFQCSTETCGEQYCGSCVRTIQGDPKHWPFHCLSCRKQVEPQRNTLIEKHLIWSNMRLLYGMGNLEALMAKSNFTSPEPLRKDIQFRRIHLLCHLDTLRHTLENHTAIKLSAEVEQLCQSMERIENHLVEIDQNFRNESIDLSDIAQKHKKITKSVNNLCEKMTFIIEQLHSQWTDLEKEELQQLYNSNRLLRLSTDQNIESIDQNLLDINARKKWLDYQIYTLENLISKDPIDSNSDLQKLLAEGREKIEELDRLLDQLNIVRRTLRATEQQTANYFTLLTDRFHSDTIGSYFIHLMERIRRDIERADRTKNFPHVVELISTWQNDDGTGENFQPKVLTMCQIIEKDLKNLFDNQRSIYSIPYRVGIVGHTSVGKSALAIALSGFTQYSSIVSLQRSTFGYLQFDTFIQDQLPNREPIPVSFIDLAGATDANQSKSMGDYLELMSNADCDLYLVVFDRLVDSQDEIWLDYIEKTLNRKCLLVRSKVDLAFHGFYKTIAGEHFQRSTSTNYDIRCTIEKIRQHAKTTWNEKHLPRQIFLTAAGTANDLQDESFGTFDFNRLKIHIRKLAREDMRISRVCRLAMLSSTTMINTCFRRAYVIAQTKYRWLAAGSSIIPLFDEIPVYFGKEEILQAFGIHDRSSISNSLQRTKDILEEYLLSQHFTVPKGVLKSSYFEYLISNESENDSMSSSSKGTVNVISRLFRDIIRIATPTAASILGIATFAGYVVGAVLTPITMYGSYYSTGKRINEHLNLLCDDLQIVMSYLIVNICHAYSINQSSPSLSSDDEENDSDDALQGR